MALPSRWFQIFKKPQNNLFCVCDGQSNRSKSMQRIFMYAVMTVAGIVIMSLSTTCFIEYLSAWLLPRLGMPSDLFKISVGELLSFFGVAAGLVFSIWTYRTDQDEKLRLAEEKVMKFKPQFAVSISRGSGSFELLIRNECSKTYKSLRYCAFGEICQLLRPGDSVNVTIVKSDTANRPDELFETHSIIDFDWYGDDEDPGIFFLHVYDSQDRPWFLSYSFKGDDISLESVSNG